MAVLCLCCNAVVESPETHDCPTPMGITLPHTAHEQGREEGRRELAERIGAVLRDHDNSRKALQQINDICYPWLKYQAQAVKDAE